MINHLVVPLALGLVVIVAPATGCICGQENIERRIINGRAINGHKYPWIVSILVKKGESSADSCGGTLINDRYILTMSMCLQASPTVDKVIIRLGAKTTNERWNGGAATEKLDVDSYKIQPQFVENGQKTIGKLALIKLKQPVTFNSTFSPICLPNFNSYSNIFVYGYGSDFGTSVVAPVLAEAEVDQVDPSVCQRGRFGPYFLPGRQICAGTKSGTCDDDSGTPLSTRYNGHVYQVGLAVIRSSPNCQWRGQKEPDIYEKMSPNLAWIEENTIDAKWCAAPDVPQFVKNRSMQRSNQVRSYEPNTPPRASSPIPAKSCACGEENLVTRIINGKVAQKDRYPWMVSILAKKEGTSFATCGGALINDRYVLTAAHCLDHLPPVNELILMLGAHLHIERWNQEGNRQKLQVEKYINHPGYDNKNASVPNDIALMKLAKPVQLGPKWRPICLPNFSQYSNIFAYGWGDQNENSKRVSASVMHEVELDEVDNSTCTNNHWGHKFLPEQHICAGTTAGTCQGDSGGPVSSRNKGHVYQVGVVSWGVIGCGIGSNMLPDISTRVTYHLPWIELNTQDAKWCVGPDVPEFTLKNLVAYN